MVCALALGHLAGDLADFRQTFVIGKFFAPGFFHVQLVGDEVTSLILILILVRDSSRRLLHRIQKCATTSISTLAPLGNPATWMVERAGKFSVKYLA